MADQLSSKRQLKPDSLKKASKNQDNSETRTSRSKAGLKKVFQPLLFIVRIIRWIGKHIVPRYFKNSFAELKLVTWPKRKEARQLTTAVLIFALVMGLVVSAVDYGLDKVFKKVILKE